MHKDCIEALDQSLAKILEMQNNRNDVPPFGRKVVVLDGFLDIYSLSYQKNGNNVPHVCGKLW